MRKFISAILLITIVLIAGCSKNDNDYYELAQKNMDAKNYATALEYFQKIVDEYPNGKHYKDALLQTGELNQGLVNKNISKEEAYARAIKAYAEFQQKYPDDKKAPQALFMIGFIQANELGQLEEAKATYNKFLELYPNSEMVESAKAEIENLGLSPDEILKKKMQNN